MRVAVTSQNFRTVTAHAGKARRFLIYDVSNPCSPREVERLDLPMEMSFHEFRGVQHPIDGVDAIVTGGAGEGFVARMGQRGIEVVMCGEDDPLQAVKDYLGGTVKPVPPGDHDDHHHRGDHQH
ncbi:nitrogen fixation protein [Azoarcus sp. L1K30]|uniref:NifB/NifX family molybdenum-iron cluster-binding protein n=1 Tax=Azoarcus sp. L1K30 TaxID=2820277 RepID=UPI001B838A45|nr:NifB/NifX family molybdenum-iron cluster-binding protein [Azoarcus sp. L1K30]MBR0564776.1 nitrogen fixation protein [Azoarcus sp. L1K30]